MDFNKLKEKYFGRSTEEIYEGLIKEENFWKNEVDIVTICLDIDRLIEQLVVMDKTHPSLYAFQKKTLVLRYILETFSTLESIPEIDTFEDFDISFEEAVYATSSKARFVRQMVEDGMNELRNVVIDEIYKAMTESVPSAQELDDLTSKLGNMFKDESPDKLKTIESILSYNDPSMKEIKDAIYENMSIKQLQKFQQK